MKRFLAFTAITAGLLGCSSVQKVPDVQKPPPRAPYASLNAAAQYERLAEELKTISVALQAYSHDHNGRLPPRLTELVTAAYLPASALISSADPSGGKEGGVPDSYLTWGQAAETDEAGSSYLYEFSEAPCKWDWRSYLGDKPDVADVDTDKDGAVSWAEVKNWQLMHGDAVQKPRNAPYSLCQFPVVRCYWYQYPAAYTNTSGRTVLNLSVDLRTVFMSQPWWEKDQ